MQERRNSIATALELRLFCTNPSMCRLQNIDCYLQVRGGGISSVISTTLFGVVNIRVTLFRKINIQV